MTTASSGDDRSVLSHVLVPVGDVDDARATARAAEPYSLEEITLVYVVEKAGGAPDKTPVEQSEQVATESFEAFRETFPDAREYVTYDRDVVDGVFEAAEDVGASAILFRPRGGSRLVQFLSGDRALRLVTESERPVVSLPFVEEDH